MREKKRGYGVENRSYLVIYKCENCIFKIAIFFAERSHRPINIAVARSMHTISPLAEMFMNLNSHDVICCILIVVVVEQTRCFRSSNIHLFLKYDINNNLWNTTVIVSNSLFFSSPFFILFSHIDLQQRCADGKNEYCVIECSHKNARWFNDCGWDCDFLMNCTLNMQIDVLLLFKKMSLKFNKNSLPSRLATLPFFISKNKFGSTQKTPIESQWIANTQKSEEKIHSMKKKIERCSHTIFL